jgi:hypothetical protein
MDIDEIEPHQYIFVIATLITSVVGEIGSIIIFEIFEEGIGNITQIIGFFFFYSIYWIILIPVGILLAYMAIFSIGINLNILSKNYRHGEGKGLGFGDIYLSATPIVCLLLSKNLSVVLGNIYLMGIIAPICFLIVFKLYKFWERHL